jgi:hypothetical protein
VTLIGCGPSLQLGGGGWQLSAVTQPWDGPQGRLHHCGQAGGGGGAPGCHLAAGLICTGCVYRVCAVTAPRASASTSIPPLCRSLVWIWISALCGCCDAPGWAGSCGPGVSPWWSAADPFWDTCALHGRTLEYRVPSMWDGCTAESPWAEVHQVLCWGRAAAAVELRQCLALRTPVNDTVGSCLNGWGQGCVATAV